MEQPLVTVICISYNHAAYVYQALSSVVEQRYSSIQLIVADDASTDDTLSEIQRFIRNHPQHTVISIVNEENTGNCMLFNKALHVAKGKYIMDLAADDFLYPSCIEQQVLFFEGQSDRVGVVFTNIDLVDHRGGALRKHYEVGSDGRAIAKIPQGDVYQNVVSRYFISPVGMMMKREVLDVLGGYDESLAYEDFDFWVRSSRFYDYAYLDACLAAKRILSNSHSTKFLSKHNVNMFVSTARVCQKASWLNKTEKENKALLKRIHYEIRQAIRYDAIPAVEIYLALLKNRKVNIFSVFFYELIFFCKRKFDF